MDAHIRLYIKYIPESAFIFRLFAKAGLPLLTISSEEISPRK